MLFRKIEINPNGQDFKGAVWYRILRTFEDVIEFTKVDAELFTKALINLPTNITKSHLAGSRERAIFAMCQTEKIKKDDINPLEITNSIVYKKAQNMLEIIQSGKTVLVQKSGSYCDYEGFQRVWEHAGFKVLEEIEKDSFYIPSDVEVMNTELIFLENDERVDVQFFNDVWSKENIGVYHNHNKKYHKIVELKNQDPKWVYEMLAKTNIIAFATDYANPTQTEEMFKAFLSFEPKRFIIRSAYMEEIMRHPKYQDLITKHQVEWI